MTACVCSSVCLAYAWILIQAWQASVGTDANAKIASSMRHVYMNWWLTPAPSNNLMKCNFKTVMNLDKLVQLYQVSYVNLHFAMYIISPEIN